MAKVYLAGGSSEVESCGWWMQRLKDAGHTVTHDWTASVRAAVLAGRGANPRDAGDIERGLWVKEDFGGVESADIFWLLIPQAPTIGAWAELGYASGLETSIIISGDWRKSIFTSLADVLCETHEEAFAIITGHREAAQ